MSRIERLYWVMGRAIRRARHLSEEYSRACARIPAVELARDPVPETDRQLRCPECSGGMIRVPAFGGELYHCDTHGHFTESYVVGFHDGRAGGWGLGTAEVAP